MHDHIPEVVSFDLWDALHDSFLRRLGSNAASESAFVAIESLHLNDFHSFAVGSEFEMRFAGVQALEVLVARQHAELETKEFPRRIESASWTDFEGTFSDETGKFENGRYEILQARLDLCKDFLTFTIDGLVDSDRFELSSRDLLHSIRILAAGVEILSPDGHVLTVESFTTLGTEYWENWRQKRVAGPISNAVGSKEAPERA